MAPHAVKILLYLLLPLLAGSGHGHYLITGYSCPRLSEFRLAPKTAADPYLVPKPAPAQPWGHSLLLLLLLLLGRSGRALCRKKKSIFKLCKRQTGGVTAWAWAWACRPPIECQFLEPVNGLWEPQNNFQNVAPKFLIILFSLMLFFPSLVKAPIATNLINVISFASSFAGESRMSLISVRFSSRKY